MILIPVHLEDHWCLATIDLKNQKAQYYDSEVADNDEWMYDLLQYLEDEHLDKKKTTFNTSNYEVLNVKDIL